MVHHRGHDSNAMYYEYSSKLNQRNEVIPNAVSSKEYKMQKNAPRKVRPVQKGKENDNTMNDNMYKRPCHKQKHKKPRMKQSKKGRHKSNHSFDA